MKIVESESLELAGISATPPLFKEPVRSGLKLLKIKTDNGIVGMSQIGGFMPSAAIAFVQKDLAPFLRGKDPSETETLMNQMMWKFNNRAHSGIWNFAVSAINVALWDIKGIFYNAPSWRLLGGAQKSLPA